MVELDDSLIISQGANRVCYRHPMRSDRCIKIPKAEKQSTQTLECDYYRRLEVNNISWRHISRYYGDVTTSLGKGYVYELVQDYDLTISLPLSDYFSKNSKIDSEMVLNSLRELKNYLLENKIIVRNIRPYNILFKRINHKEGYAVLIDNIGHHNRRYHLSDNIAFLARKDIQKKWSKFELGLQETAGFKSI